MAAVVVTMATAAGCRFEADGGDGRADNAAADPVEASETVGAAETAVAEAGGAGLSVPESDARIVGSLPESSVVVVAPDAGSRSERIEDLAESVGASLEDDTARIVVEESVLFEFGSAELLESASEVLDDIADLLTELAAERTVIVGHTDSVGSDASNLELSNRRARAVEEGLVDRGVDPGTLEAQGVGESEPVAPNENADGSDNPEGRARNRRVEITATGISD